MRCVLVSLRGEDGFFLLLELPSFIYGEWRFCLGFRRYLAGFEGFFVYQGWQVVDVKFVWLIFWLIVYVVVWLLNWLSIVGSEKLKVC